MGAEAVHQNISSSSLVMLLGAVFLSACADDTDENLVVQMMKKHEVVPDLIAVAPKNLLEVKYDSGVKAELGNVLTPTQVKNPPSLSWDAEPDAFYTLCLTVPDAPTRQNQSWKEWHHWLVGNIKGSDVSTGEVLSAYIGSGPPKGTGLHRYVFLVYKQPGKLEFDEPRLTNRSPANRSKFSITKLAEKYRMGEPIAGNFYQAEWDEYSLVIFKQLRGQ